MVLSAEQRRVQEEEAQAKRQKVKEDKERVAKQFAQDRVDRAELHGSVGGAGLREQVSAVATPAATPAAAKGPESSSVRLQIRATQHWNKVVVFTQFSPDSTLSEVAHALREELIKGMVTSDDDAAVRARMPEEAAITFVETVPPRRRWASQDMQQTLRSAGLCPSGSLMAEVPPIEPPAAPAPTATAAAEAEDGDEPPAATEEDDTKGGKGGAGRGGVTINWIKGGNGKGSAGKGSAAGRSPPPGDDDDDDDGSDSDDPDDSDDAMMKGKGIFGKGKSDGPRGKGKGPQGHEFPESGGQALGSGGTADAGAAGGAALAQYSTVAAAQPAAAEQPASSAEQQKAARDARLAALERRGMAASSSAAPKAAGEAPCLARSSAEPKGQMGDGQNRAERDRERQAILSRLADDKEDQLIRRPVRAAVTSTQAAQAETSGVRLQIRCPVSKRIHIPVGLKEASLLGEVLASASAELDMKEAVLSLGYPPWTEFKGGDVEKTLKELGLCPSATLLIKSTAVVVEAPADATAVAPAAAADDSAPPTTAAAADDSAPPTTAAAADDSAPPATTCPKGHAMTELTQAAGGGWCDKCNATLAEGSVAFECKTCDFVVCPKCSKLGKS